MEDYKTKDIEVIFKAFADRGMNISKEVCKDFWEYYSHKSCMGWGTPNNRINHVIDGDFAEFLAMYLQVTPEQAYARFKDLGELS